MMTQNQIPSLSYLALNQFVVGLLATIAGCLLGSVQLGASIAVGAALMLFNVLILGWMWLRLFAKKSIAWTSLIIVIKYAVLLGSIFYLTRMDWFRPVGAGVGILSFLLAALCSALIASTRKSKEDWKV